VRSLTDCGDFRSADIDPDSPQRRDEVHHSRVRTNAGILLTGRLVTPSAIISDGAVVVDGDRIAFAGKASELPQQWTDVQPPTGWIGQRTLLPGLVDVHCHGGGGGEFGPDTASAALAVDHHHLGGTTSLVGSLVSNTHDALVSGVTTCAALVAQADLAGIHLEGPFLSMERRGAQNPAALCDVDAALVEALAEAATAAGAPKAIAQMTFAPERPGAADLPALLGSHAILAAVGHTACDAETAWAALRASLDAAPRGGRPLVTHVFNGMAPLHHRAPGPVSAALAAAARGEAVLEVVGDGVHLAPATVRMLFDLVGAQGICLITDAMAASGMPDGTYTLGGQDVIVSGRTARLAEGNSIAGGVATMLDVVRWCVQSAGIPLLDAVTAASSTPSQTLALAGIGGLQAGNLADVVVVDDQLSLHAVMRRGQWLFEDIF
jgi:N-acetylglucosamine-6-phosphate deacetylase